VLLVDDHEVIWSGMKGVMERLAAQQRPGAPFEWFCARDLAGTLAGAACAPDLILLDTTCPAPTAWRRCARCAASRTR
jgi:hypothetical protein